MFIFINIKWSEVVKIFKENNIYISGGHSTKRHIISSTQRRLCSILDNLNIGLNFSIKNYHKNDNLLTTNYSDLYNISLVKYKKKNKNKTWYIFLIISPLKIIFYISNFIDKFIENYKNINIINIKNSIYTYK